MACIYIIKNKINKKVYIGQTRKNISERWKQHIDNAIKYKREQVIYQAMRKYGIDNFYIEALKEIKDINKIDKYEKKYIKEYNSLLPNGYNMLKGGSKFENDNPMFHEEIKEKVSQYFKQNNPSKRLEVRNKIRQSKLGEKPNEITRKKMSINNGRFWKGKHLTEEHKRKISQNHAQKGKFGGLNPNAKAIICIDKKTNKIINEFDSIANAVRKMFKNENIGNVINNISNCIHNRQKTAYGYKWQFKMPIK